MRGVSLVATTANSYTRFERARIVGARALQIAMGAPILIELEGAVMNPVDVAMREFHLNLIPITVKRSVPPKQEVGSRLFPRKTQK